MNFNNNIQNLRKRENMSQEELAEKLNVSRQAISKWESGDCYPETEKLLTICSLFNCSLDELFNGNILIENTTTEKAEYESINKKLSIGVSGSIFLILVGVTILLTMLSLSPNKELQEKYAIIGVVILMIFVLIALPILIIVGIGQNNFKEKNKTLPEFYTQEEIEKFNKKFAKGIALGVSFILLGVIVLLAIYGLEIYSSESIMPVSFLMSFIAIGVPILIYFGIEKDKYDIKKYNRINGKEYERTNELMGKISGIIMIVTTMIYLILGFVFNLWKYTWLLYPISGMLCGIVAIILNKEN